MLAQLVGQVPGCISMQVAIVCRLTGYELLHLWMARRYACLAHQGTLASIT